MPAAECNWCPLIVGGEAMLAVFSLERLLVRIFILSKKISKDIYGTSIGGDFDPSL